MELTVKRFVDDGDRRDIVALLDAARAADGHDPLSDHAWLDLVDGGRPGFAALEAWLAGHDHPVAYCQLSLAPAGGRSWSIDLVIHPHHRLDGVDIGRLLVGGALDVVRGEGGGHIHFWVSHPNLAHDRLADELGLDKGRDLLNLRRPLPVPGHTDVVTRSFRVGVDEAAWLEANNAAFSWHPEQGGWTADELKSREHEDWFDPTGFLLHERDGRLAAFNWTKIHPGSNPVLGEIYVIGVHPDFQGLGLGKKLALAGLRSLFERGAQTAMLYVDSSNEAARALYAGLGFREDHVNRAYVGDIQPAKGRP